MSEQYKLGTDYQEQYIDPQIQEYLHPSKGNFN